MKTVGNDTEGDPGGAARLLRLLLAFTPQDPVLTAEQAARQANVPLSSTYRYLSLLRQAGLLDSHAKGQFSLAPLAVRIGEAARAGMRLAPGTAAVMRELTAISGETVILLCRSGDYAVCVERTEPEQRVRIRFEVGTALPLHRGAGPKLLLASMPAAERDALAKRLLDGDEARIRALLEELEAIRAQGWSESAAEIEYDVWAMAAPILAGGEVVAAISIVVPRYRVTPDSRLQAIDSIRAAAATLSQGATP